MATVTGEGSVLDALLDTKEFIVIRVGVFLSLFLGLSVWLFHLTICRYICLSLSLSSSPIIYVSISLIYTSLLSFSVFLSIFLTLFHCLLLSISIYLWSPSLFFYSLPPSLI